MSRELLGRDAPELSRRTLLLGALFGAALVSGLSIDTYLAIPVAAADTNMTSGIVPDTNDTQLPILEYYEKEASVEPRMMKFIGFPESQEDARSLAANLAGILEDWHKKDVRPLIIMEPTFNGGQTNMNLVSFNQGKYDKALNTFFDSLASLGISSEEMGTWVPFPEPNDPGWANNVTSPALFSQNVTKVAEALKAKFPRVPVSVMLDSQTSIKANYSDATINPEALLKYLGFKPGLISSFGLQGFTWDNKDNPSIYLSAETAIIGAKKLGIKHVWFNTGTYSKANNPNGEGIIEANNERRAEVLAAVLQEALAVQATGFKVDFINIFAQDNFVGSPSGSGTAAYQYTSPGAIDVLKTFVKDSSEHGIPVTIFDAPSS